MGPMRRGPTVLSLSNPQNLKLSYKNTNFTVETTFLNLIRKKVKYLIMLWTDGPTDKPTDKQTEQGAESRAHNKKLILSTYHKPESTQSKIGHLLCCQIICLSQNCSSS